MNSYPIFSSRVLRPWSFALAAIFLSQTAFVPSAAAAVASSEFENLDKELDDLDAKIQDHLKRAREASFWKPEHTVAPPGQTQAPGQIPAAPAPTAVKAPAAAQTPVAVKAPTAVKAPVAVKALPAPASQTSVVPPSSGSTPSSSNVVPARRPATESAPTSRSLAAPTAATTPVPAPVPAPASSTAPAPDAKQILNQNYEDLDSVDREIASRTRVSGTYRAAFGAGRNRAFSGNDSNPDLQDRDFHYLFGDRQYNTFDPAIYSQYRLNIDSQLTKTDSVFVQLVADPWSYVGQTSEINVPGTGGTDSIRVKQKYWGPNNSTIPQSVVSQNGNAVLLPELEAKDGHTQAFNAPGRNPYASAFFPNYNVPEQEIDYEFRPLRKAWWDHDGDVWHTRVFALADQNQVLTTDDPMQLSNRKDFWEHSAWLDQWSPQKQLTINGFSPNLTHGGRPVISRGRYSDEEAFYAKDSQGNYMTLLRGVAAEANYDKTYVGMMVASRYGLWDEYQEFDNIPGVVRVKQQITEPWMVGGTYTHRVGMVDREPDAINQVYSVDTRYYTNETDHFYGQVATSTNRIDRLSSFPTDYAGQAYKLGVLTHTDSAKLGITRWILDFSWIDTKFKETLSKYSALRDDEFWGNHISWAKIPPDVDPFKIGTGEDYGRYVIRMNAATSNPENGIDNLFDIRFVSDVDSNGYTHLGNDDDDGFIETVIRDEFTYKFKPDWTFKGLTRVHVLPDTLRGVEPFIAQHRELYIPQLDDPALEAGTYYDNALIEAGLDATRWTVGSGLQWEASRQWTLDGTLEFSNDIPDFPRGLLNDIYPQATFIDPFQPNLALYRQQAFLYRQDIFGLPPYDHFSIVKERVTYRPTENLQFIFHAAQNSYTLWGPNDENVDHQGISVDWQIDERWSLFTDLTHTRLADIPKLISTNYTDLEFDDHYNWYGVLKYRINTNTMLTMEYGVFGKTFYEGSDALPINPYAVTNFSLPTVDTEHLFRLSLDGEF